MIDKSAFVHPTAIVEEGASIGANAHIGPFCIVGPHVEIGEGTVLKSHVVVNGHTKIGRDNEIYQFASIGEVNQDLKYAGEPTRVEIGDRNRIRESVTIHRGTVQGGGLTKVGSDNLLMINAHIAHDCTVGNRCILANNATLAGHVSVDDFAIIGGMTAVHQFCIIGAHVMVGGCSGVAQDVPPYVIVPAMIEAHKAGLSNITRDELEAHYMAGGHVEKVVHALVSASKANIELSFQMATGIDLAGRDVFEAVQMSVNPKVIDTPPVTAVAKDGIQLIAKARVTVRANIRQLVGGAGEDTILARVGEGIVSSIGSSESHKQVLENPDSISKLVLKKGLDSGTAFEILSIDIADIDIGKNIGATLQMDQAQADKNIAQAKAEERRAMAIALEQEMKAKAQEARAKVIEAEAEVPRAMAEAFRSGNLGIMDYYKMKNVEADTAMRESIAKPSSKPEK